MDKANIFIKFNILNYSPAWTIYEFQNTSNIIKQYSIPQVKKCISLFLNMRKIRWTDYEGILQENTRLVSVILVNCKTREKAVKEIL